MSEVEFEILRDKVSMYIEYVPENPRLDPIRLDLPTNGVFYDDQYVAEFRRKSTLSIREMCGHVSCAAVVDVAVAVDDTAKQRPINRLIELVCAVRFQNAHYLITRLVDYRINN